MPIDAGLGLLLGLTIVFVILATAVARIHPFLVLLAASYAVAIAAGLPAATAVTTITQAFGATLQSIGIVIAAGAIIGTCLERGGGARRMAETITRWTLRLRAAPAASMSVTGAVVSVPVFCDAGFIVLAPLCRALAVASRASMATFAVALSLGLYTTHVLVPPTPGPFAAAGQLGADVGLVILLGLIVTVPVLATTYVFATWMGGRIFIDPARARRDRRRRSTMKRPMPGWTRTASRPPGRPSRRSSCRWRSSHAVPSLSRPARPSASVRSPSSSACSANRTRRSSSGRPSPSC